MKTTSICNLSAGQSVDDWFALAEARQAQGRNGPYWSLKLQDASGSLEAKIFSPVSRNYPELSAGSVVRVAGQVQTFRDQLQIVVERLEIYEGAPTAELLRGLIPCSAVRPDALLADLEQLVLGVVRHRPWRAFFRSVLADETIRTPLLLAPGAKSIHHAYAGGLLEHTLAVCRLCMAMAGLYPQLDRETLVLGAAFHDLGKAWELTSGLTREYTDEGRLLGHLLIGLERLTPHLEATPGLDAGLKTHFKHLILSHHGELEYGSPRRPKTAEAMILHYADNIDAKMATVAQQFTDAAEGAWSPFVRALDRYLHKPVSTPKPAPDQDPLPGLPTDDENPDGPKAEAREVEVRPGDETSWNGYPQADMDESMATDIAHQAPDPSPQSPHPPAAEESAAGQTTPLAAAREEDAPSPPREVAKASQPAPWDPQDERADGIPLEPPPAVTPASNIHPDQLCLLPLKA